MRYSTKEKIIHFIGVTGNTIKNGKDYYYFGIHPRNIKFYTKRYGLIKQTYYGLIHKLLTKITPLLNFIFNKI